MKLPLKVWFIVSLTLAFIAVIISLVYRVTITDSVSSLVVIVLLILAILGAYALILYFTIRPSLKKLKSLPMAILVTLVATGAIVDATIHFIRFVPSPKASSPLSVIIASLLLAASLSGYLLALWLIWRLRKGKKV